MGAARLQKAACPDTPLRARSRDGGRADAAPRRDHSAGGPGAGGAMLRVRCLRGGSRGAEAVHYIGSQVRASAAALCPSRQCRPGPFCPLWEARLQESLLAAGSVAGSPAWGHTPRVPWVSARLRPRWPSAQGTPPSSAASLSLHGACGPEGTGVTRAPFSKKVLLLGFSGHRVGHACGVDGDLGRRGSGQAHSKCNMDAESRGEVGAGVVCAQSFCPVPALHFPGV